MQRQDQRSGMTAWYSLAGYLQLRPGGALGRWKSRRRQWYVLDEERCELLFYRSEAECPTGPNAGPNAPVDRRPPPLGTIPLRHAAVSLVLEEDNQFLIHAEGKEYVLTADNHESMMIWVMALQAKREEPRYAGPLSPRLSHDPNCLKVTQSGSRRTSLADASGESEPQGVSSRIFRHHSWQVQRRPSMSRWWRTSQSGEGNRPPPSPRPRQCTSLREPLRSDANNNSNNLLQPRPRRDSPCLPRESSSDSSDSSSGGGGEGGGDGDSCPEVLELDDGGRGGSSPEEEEEEEEEEPDMGDAKARHLRHLNTPSAKDRTGSMSGASVSSDSAVGVDRSGGQCAHSLRLGNLESELTSLKCQLAQALDRESNLRRRLSENPPRRRLQPTGSDPLGRLSSPIPEQSARMSHRGSPAGTLLPSPPPEQQRILQNLNRFLNEEVLRLSRLLQDSQQKQQAQAAQLREMESSLESFKRDYVFLMQSSLRITCPDGPEQQEVYLYGGRRHKERVLSLLDDARRRNPTLPVYDRCSPCLCHVDPLGFRHFLTDEALALHYVCSQLHQHYTTCSATVHLQRWKDHLRANLHLSCLEPSKELKMLVRRGIPPSMRSRVWCLLFRARIQDLRDAKGSNYYNSLCSLAPDSTVVAQHKRQISLDLLRTMPNNIRFSDQNADGVRKMQEVLQAFCLHNPALGYCQGMNFLAGMCLLFMEPENAFWCLVAIAERFFPVGYFDLSLIGAQADQEVLKDLVREKLPALHRHLLALDIELCTVTLNWFLAIFFDVVPMETLLRIWDCFLLEGPKVLFRFSLAMLKLQEAAILARKDTVFVMRQLKSASKLAYDVDGLFKIAFEELEPFPRRKDIVAKQAYYYRSIQDRTKRREAEKAAVHAKEALYMEPERNARSPGVGGAIECASVYDKDKLWLVHGHQDGAQVSKVNCEESIMYRLNRQFDSRVMCMHTLDDDVMLLGTLSHLLYGYSTRSRKLLWEVRLNDSVLSLCSQQEDSVRQIFAGLADGTVAVVEKIQGVEPKPETFYVLIGSNPVTCLTLVERRLWCACGNRMVILNARTLDNVDSFQTSCSTMDYISQVCAGGAQGVWITLRGSSVLQLWDPKALVCRLLFDIHTNAFAKWIKDDPTSSIPSTFSITSLLPLDGSILVGTAEGSLVFYDVRSRNAPAPFDVPNPEEDKQNQEGHMIPRAECVDPELEDVLPFLRERNDSGCYSATTVANLSRRASGMVPELAFPLSQESELSQTLQEDRSEEATTLRHSSSYSGADTVVSPGETLAWDEDVPVEVSRRVSPEGRTQSDQEDPEVSVDSHISQKFLRECPSFKSWRKDHADLEDPEVCTSVDLESRKYFLLGESPKLSPRSWRKIQTQSDTDDTEVCRPMDSRKFFIQSEDLDIASKPWRRTPSPRESKEPRNRTFSSLLRDISKGSRRNRSVSLSDIRVRSSGGRRRRSAISVDDLPQWMIADSTGFNSSVGSDSYEFDDLLIPYTEDEIAKGAGIRPNFSFQEAEILIQTLRRQNGFNMFPKSEEGSDFKESTTPQIRLDPSLLRSNDSWSSFRGDGTSTNGYSCDGASTPGAVDPELLLPGELMPNSAWLGMQPRHLSSETSSNLSANSDVSYAVDLIMQEKIKISDKPIKCLLKTKTGEELSVVSCAGCYGDDESVLRWTREGPEKLWTNDPIIEVCPYTNRIRPSPFTRSRLPRRASLQVALEHQNSSVQFLQSSGQPGKLFAGPRASIGGGSPLARMHSMFTKNHDKA